MKRRDLKYDLNLCYLSSKRMAVVCGSDEIAVLLEETVALIDGISKRKCLFKKKFHIYALLVAFYK